MSSSYETCTKEKVISYEQRLFIKTALRKIGINSNNNGFILFQKAIIYTYKKDMITINLEDIYKHLGEMNSKPHKTIESIIRYSFYNVNIKNVFKL